MENNKNQEKNDAQIGGRVPTSMKMFIDGLYKEIGSFPAVMQELKNTYEKQKLENIEREELSFKEDYVALEKYARNIQEIMKGIRVKTSQYAEEKVKNANAKITQKDEILKRYNEVFEEVIGKAKEENDSLKEENKKQLEEIKVFKSQVEEIRQVEEILKLEKNNLIKEVEMLISEKTKLLSDVTNQNTRNIELQEKVNSMIKDINERDRLKSDIEAFAEIRRGLMSKIENKNIEIVNEKKNVIKLEEENKNILEKLENIKDEKGKMEIEHAKAIVISESKIKEKIEAKYEKEIKELKEKVFKMEILQKQKEIISEVVADEKSKTKRNKKE